MNPAASPSSPPLFSLLSRAARRALWRHPWRTLLVLFSTALGTAAMIATFAVDEQVLDAFGNLREETLRGAPLAVRSDAGAVDEALADAIEAVPGVRLALPTSRITAGLRPPHDGTLLIVGADPAKAERLRPDEATGFDLALTARATLSGEAVCALDEATARALDLGVGDAFSVRGPNGPIALRVVGLFSAGRLAALTGGRVAAAPLPVLRRLRGGSPGCDRIDVFLEGDADIAEVAGALARVLPQGSRLETGTMASAGAERGFAAMSLSLLLAALTAIVAGAFVVFNVHALTLAERRPALGTARALGATRRQLLRPLLLEGLLLGVVGALVGLGLGWLASWLVVTELRDALPVLGLPGEAAPRLPGAGKLIGAVGLGVLATLAATAGLAWRAARVPPTVSWRPQAHAVRRGAGTPLAARIAFGLVLVLNAVVLLGPIESEAAPWIGVAALALGFVVAGPVACRLLLDAVASRRKRPVVLRFALDGLRRAPGRTGLTVAALGLAAMLVSQAVSVGSTFRSHLLPWVDRSIPGDWFVTSGSQRIAAGRNQPVSAALLESLRRIEGVTTVRGVRSRFVDLGGLPVALVGVDVAMFTDHALLDWKEGDPVEALRAFREGSAVLVSDNFAALHGKGVGAALVLPGQRGVRELPIAGVVVDFSWTQGTVLVDRRVLRELLADDTIDVAAVSFDEGVDVATQRARLEGALDAGLDPVILSAVEFRAMISDELEALFSFADAQEAVALVIAFLAVLNTVALSLITRKPEFALLSAVGATPRQLAGSAAVEGALLAGLGIASGLLAGLPVSVLMLRDLLRQTTGWSMGLVIPWGSLALFVIGALFLGAAAGRFGLGLSRRTDG